MAYNLARNEYLVTWDLELTAQDLDIWGIRLNGLAQPLWGGDPYQLGEFNIAGWPAAEEHPAVASCWTQDQYLVAWQSDKETGNVDFAIYARFLTGDAVPGGVFLVSDTPAPQIYTDVACDAYGKRYLLAWADKYVGGEYGIWARFAYTNGTLGSEFEVEGPRFQADRLSPAVAGGKANFLAAWEHDRDNGNVDIHGRLLGYFLYLPILTR